MGCIFQKNKKELNESEGKNNSPQKELQQNGHQKDLRINTEAPVKSPRPNLPSPYTNIEIDKLKTDEKSPRNKSTAVSAIDND